MGVLRLMCLLHLVQSALIETPFQAIESDNSPQFVVFYFKGHKDSLEVLDAANKASERLGKEAPKVKFRKCNGDLPENQAAFQRYGFTAATYVFTTSAEEGIVKHVGSKSTKSFVNLIRSKAFPANSSDLVHFRDEEDFWELMDLSESPRPILVLFRDNLCNSCTRMFPGLNVLGSVYKNSLITVEVNCDEPQSIDFCHRQAGKSFPKLVLFTGEDQIQIQLPEGLEVPSFFTYSRIIEKHGIVPLEIKKGFEVAPRTKQPVTA